MNRSESVIELIKALNKCQSEIKGAIKDTKNTFYNNAKYADLASVWEAIREPMTKHGLAITQTTQWAPEDSKLMLMTTLFHISGEWLASNYPIMPMMQKKATPDSKAEWVDTNNPQAMGSCITYARRYSLMAIIGIAPEDDDGNLASGLVGKPEINLPKAKEIVVPNKNVTPEAFLGAISRPEPNRSDSEPIPEPPRDEDNRPIKEKIQDLLLELAENGKVNELVEEATSFLDKKNGNTVPGKKDFSKVSEKQYHPMLRFLRELKKKREEAVS